MSESLAASTQSAQSTQSTQSTQTQAQAKDTPSTAGLALSPDPAGKADAGAASQPLNAKNVATPGELCGFVDTLLSTLETRFDDMSEQVLARMSEMSARIDNLETAISDLMHAGEPARPSPAPAQRR